MPSIDPRTALTALLVLLAPAGCGRMSEIGQAPELTPMSGSNEHFAMAAFSLPEVAVPDDPLHAASLWEGGPRSLLGDRRATRRGDILTVVIEIDERAEMSNASDRSRSGNESMSVPGLLGLPQQLDARLPEGASAGSAVDLSSSSASSGSGAIRRREKLQLRVAATITEVLPNGALRIEGTQEVRVNYELRELLVSGYVRPEDISRRNEITYDKIASARVSYGGRGRVSEVQQPRYGQQALDALMPF